MGYFDQFKETTPEKRPTGQKGSGSSYFNKFAQEPAAGSQDEFVPPWEDPTQYEQFASEEEFQRWQQEKAEETAIRETASPAEMVAAIYGGMAYGAWRGGATIGKALVGALPEAAVGTATGMPVAKLSEWVQERYGWKPAIAIDLVLGVGTGMTIDRYLMNGLKKAGAKIRPNDSISALRKMPTKQREEVTEELDALLRMGEDRPNVLREGGEIRQTSDAEAMSLQEATSVQQHETVMKTAEEREILYRQFDGVAAPQRMPSDPLPEHPAIVAKRHRDTHQPGEAPPKEMRASTLMRQIREAETSEDRSKLVEQLSALKKPVRGTTKKAATTEVTEPPDVEPYSKRAIETSRVDPLLGELDTRTVYRPDGKPFTKRGTAETLAGRKYGDLNWQVVAEEDGWVIKLEELDLEPTADAVMEQTKHVSQPRILRKRGEKVSEVRQTAGEMTDPAMKTNLIERETIIREIAAKKQATKITVEDEVQGDLAHILSDAQPKQQMEMPPQPKLTKNQRDYFETQRALDEYYAESDGLGFGDVPRRTGDDVVPDHRWDHLDDDTYDALDLVDDSFDTDRSIGEIGQDLYTVFGGKLGLSIEDITKNSTVDKIKAAERLVKDLKRHHSTAMRAGLSLTDYYQRLGFDEGMVERMVKYTDAVMARSPDDPAFKKAFVRSPAAEEVPAEEGAATAAELFDPSRNRREGFMSTFAVEYPFRKAGAPESGFAFKTYNSVRDAFETEGIHTIQNLYRGKHTNLKDMNPDERLHVLFLREDPQHDISGLPEDVQQRVRAGAKELGRYLDKSFGDLKKEEILEKPFPESYVARLRTERSRLMKRMSEQMDEKTKLRREAKLASVNERIGALEGKKYVPILTEWLNTTIRNKPDLGRRVISILNQHKRKTPTLKSLLEITDKQGNKILKPEDIDVAEMLAVYAKRKGKDIANTRLKRALEGDGLIRQMEKKARGKGYKPLPKGDPARDWPWVDSSTITTMKGYIAQPKVKEHLEGFYRSSGSQHILERILNAAKVFQFHNPFILGMYNTYQTMMVHNLNMWRAPKHIKQAMKDVLQYSDDYHEACLLGLTSKPYSNPVGDWQDMIKTAKMPMWKRYQALLNPLPHKIIKNYYNLSWDIAWGSDAMLRMASYRELLQRGLSKRDAAQTAALFHGDYASVPADTRRVLNKLFFTPTYKIVMAQMHKQIVEAGMDTAKSLAKLQLPGKKTRVLAGGLLALVAANLGKDLLMRQQGFKADQFGRRYTKEIDTHEGKREVVVTLSDPTNLALKFYHKAAESMWGRPSDDSPIGKLYNELKYELHPLHRIIGLEIARNRDMGGNKIYEYHDSNLEKVGKMLRYTFYEFLPVTQVIDYRPEDTEERELLDRHFGKLTHKIMSLVTYPYTRGTVEGRVQSNIRTITSQVRDAARDKVLTPDMLERARDKIDRQLEILQDAREDRKKPSGWKLPVSSDSPREEKGVGMDVPGEEVTGEKAEIDLGRISQIESSGDPDAVSHRGARYGRGLHQVSEAALQDYNSAHDGKIKPSELFDTATNTKVARWYFDKLEGYLRSYNIPVTEEHLLVAYNWGIGNMRKWYQSGADPEKLPAETRGYLTKYRKRT